MDPENPSENRVVLEAPAKVNLRLEVLSRRQDGYHNLQMVNVCLDLHDTVEIERAPSGIRLSVDDPSLAADADNLAYRAASAVLAHARREDGLAITIRKRIPIAAGLGGGSSDAAAVILGVDRLLGLRLSVITMHAIGLALGADVPFFIEGRPAVVRGIGDLVGPIDLDAQCAVVLLNPGFPVSTKEVYRACASTLTLPASATTLPPRLDRAALPGLLRNDLRAVVAGRHPQIEAMEKLLAEHGAFGAMMSGSGPTVFGLFDDRAGLGAVRDEAERRGWRFIETRLRTRRIPVGA